MRLLPQHSDARYAQLFMRQPALHPQLGLERSYGFLLAAASAPSLVMPDEWLQAVWREPPAGGLDSELREALVGLYNHWLQQRRQPALQLPGWTDNPEAMAAFCRGYLAGQDWLHNLWQDALQRFGDSGDERTLSGTLLLCLRLSGDTDEALSDRLSEADARRLLPGRLQATAQLAERLLDLHQQQLMQQASNPLRHTGRNDPCPCGSGKKFKKCCGR
ncbi:SEC-C metal-binding domain-containing protein [Marinobacterium arenosum]|uniref:SEC-C metal-binding domain-containing protein n=1 Tax=Marinobacterium arenosum TaxID=2862496 RepID=UPI001C9386DE|nr:SEC-C metal-binding domain-containing protein [Marinobacterium arenosum]MBY4677044.1 SEC-C domain-containing protein [Marinobacterium arenosum]